MNIRVLKTICFLVLFCVTNHANARLILGFEMYSEPLEIVLISGTTQNAKLSAYSGILGFSHILNDPRLMRISLGYGASLGAGIVKNADANPSNEVQSSYTFFARPYLGTQLDLAILENFQNSTPLYAGFGLELSARLQNLGRVSGGEYEQDFWKIFANTSIQLGTQFDPNHALVLCYKIAQFDFSHSSYELRYEINF